LVEKVKITFKNVGQGDSIIIEWKEENIPKIGIVDCNLTTGNNNPVKEHIISHEYTEIDFMILSHPHFDHFSGFYSLLEYCVNKPIKVNHFLYSSRNDAEYINDAHLTSNGKTELKKLIRLVYKLDQSKFLEASHINSTSFGANPAYSLISKRLFLQFLAPSFKEFTSFIKMEPFFKYANPDEDIESLDGNANWISTVIKIYSNDWYLLLTSDASRDVLQRLGVDKTNQYFNSSLVLGQAPHHGSENNSYPVFWKLRTKANGTPIAISVGANSYGHPSINVIDSFTKNNFEVFTTAPMSKTSSIMTNKANLESMLLGTSSSVILNNSGQDLVFEFEY